MSNKMFTRLKMALYVLILILAELIQTSVFGSLRLGIIPCVMPVAVSCISVREGAENGGIFGLAGGCLWAWSTHLSYYGAWCIVAMTAVGVLAGLVVERFLLQGIKTALTISAGAVILTDGLYTLFSLFSRIAPFYSIFTTFLPGAVISMILCLLFYPLTLAVSRIGGSHG